MRPSQDAAGSGGPRIILGPMLRYVSETEATLWLETDRSTEVTVTVTAPSRTSSFTQRTWSTHGSHYALMVLTGLDPDTNHRYEITCDGSPAWPLPEIERTFGPSWIRTFDRTASGRIVFGSCRRVAPLTGWGLTTFGADALVALAYRLRQSTFHHWPDMLMLGGDQLYADELNSEAKRHLHRVRRADHLDDGWDEVHNEAITFEEYRWLYHQSWTPAPIRWLFSTISSSMILDDHDLRDDWNISAPWRAQVSAQPWWNDKVAGAFGSYWIYQHLGNLSPTALERDPTYQRILAAPDDASRRQVLDRFAHEADANPSSHRWSFARDLGNDRWKIRVVVIDSRCSRCLTPRDRKILDDAEFGWLRQQLTEDRLDHLVIVSTLPVFLPPGVHHLEAWNAAMADGRWPGRLQRWSENLRQALDLEHWAAFGSTMTKLVELLAELGSGPNAPASTTILGGDVHCSYLAAVELPGVDPSSHPVWQVTMSPFRNPLDSPIRIANRLAAHRFAGPAMERLARTVGANRVPAQWAITDGPWFANGLGILDFSGEEVRVTLEHATHAAARHLLRRTTARRLSATPSDVVEQAAARGRPVEHLS